MLACFRDSLVRPYVRAGDPSTYHMAAGWWHSEAFTACSAVYLTFCQEDRPSNKTSVKLQQQKVTPRTSTNAIYRSDPAPRLRFRDTMTFIR
jgi:hypothetical protein